MKLVKQEAFGDCGPACVATVLGWSLQKARDVLGDSLRGIDSLAICDVLSENDVPAMESLVWPSSSIPGILSVPSLNYPGLLHFIVWDGAEYLDPSNDPKRYPEDGPVVDGVLQPPQWASVILMWPQWLQAMNAAKTPER